MAALDILRIVFSLIVVLSLIGITAFLLKRFGVTALANGVARKRRLAISETLAIDSRRRLMIVKCDGAEHLLLLGANSETVISATNAENCIGVDESEAAGATPRNPFATSQIVVQREKSAA